MKLRRPLGLVLAGGGAHGAWQAGVVSRWAETHGLKFDHILGFSIGSLVGAGYVFNRIDSLMSLWSDIDRARIMRWKPRLFPASLFGNDSIREAVSRGGSDEEAKKRTRCRFTVVTYCLEEKRHHYFRFTPGGTDGWHNPFSDHLVASCSIPYIFPPVRLRKNGRTLTYVDGGVHGERPASFGALRRCKDVIVLQMIRHDEIGRKPLGLLARREQRGREELYEFISHGIRPLLESNSDVRVFRYFPSHRLAHSMLAFNSRACEPALRLGRRDADIFLDHPARYRVA
ncbi:MAG: patatin-like phospholipase family protein [Elusimicrobiota bacterium]